LILTKAELEIKPLSFEMDGNGEFKVIDSRAKGLDRGAINAMVETARNISHDYEYGFKETGDPESCKECGFRMYCDGINL
jgi:DNA helicase-2/ATP-dependent DNA helicase PcrA